ncbi:MAG: DoxX family protein [Prevotellaceae bacterium]|jgi:uncharacterized membrane protein YphA (DoxX/SURF4 family)|nr:DoxX family protein [Prevotellaceae bacterium]
MKCIIRIVTRIAVGVLFIFSGYVKAIDPVGSAIKFGEYFEAFGVHFLVPSALIFGISLAVAELVTGLCFLFGVKIKLASTVALIFMIFMTLLTFVLAITDMVRDCGCFGDAIKLTNWQTFYKNLIIDPFVIYVFVNRKNYRQFFSQITEWTVFALIAVVALNLSIYCYKHLPLIDFIAYKVGTNIPDAMTAPEGAQGDVYEEGTYIYEKNGEKKSFTLENLPDSTWTFVDAPAPKLLKKGYVPPASDFSISSELENIHSEIFAQGGYMIFLTSQNVNTMTTGKSNLLNSIYEFSKENKINFIMLSGSSPKDNENYVHKTGAAYPVYMTDPTVLKSMVRSNPGMMLLKDNTVLKKWNCNDFPSIDELKELLASDSEEIIKNHYKSGKQINNMLAGIVLLVFVIISITGIIRRKY